MPVSIIRNVGTAKRNINDYIPSLLKNVFPQLQQFGINMYDRPFMQDKVTVSYNGDTYDNERLRLYFNCIHSELEADNESEIFVDAEYNSNYFPIGKIDINQGQSAAEIIYAGLYEEGYRTEQDKKQDKAQAEKEKAEKEQKEKEALEKKKKDRQAWKQSQMIQQKEPDETEQVNDQEEIKESQEEFSKLFDIYLERLREVNQPNGSIVISIMITDTSNNNLKGKFLGVDLYYIGGNQCLMQTNQITPKIDQVTTWDKAKNYCLKVAEKFNGSMSIYGVDHNGKEIELTQDELNTASGEDSDNIDTGISLD